MATVIFLILVLILKNLSNKKTESEIILKIATPAELNISQKTETVIPQSESN
jgi:preprotein translocase subunit SecG